MVKSSSSREGCQVEALEARALLSAAPSASVENLDILPGPERLVFNYVKRPDASTPNVFHDKATMRLHNNGGAPLVISTIAISGPWKIVSASPMTSIPAGGFKDITLQFIATKPPPYKVNETAGTTNGKYAGSYIGSLTLGTNDPKQPKVVEQLAGWYQDHSEWSEEPSLKTLINTIFNYKTNITPTTPSPFLPVTSTKKYYGEEVVSAYWQAADPKHTVGVTELAAFHMQGSPTTLQWNLKGTRAGPTLFVTSGAEGQSFLPHQQGKPTVRSAANFSTSKVFEFKIDYEHGDDKQNNSGGQGHHIRYYPLRDHLGNIIPNTYLMCLDYSPGFAAAGENFDFQDHVYVVTNVKPAGN